jgi:hypothetical protein
MMNDEPTLTRIRNARQHISAKCGHDPKKLVEYYMELQKQYQDRLIPRTRPLEMVSVNDRIGVDE